MNLPLINIILGILNLLVYFLLPNPEKYNLIIGIICIIVGYLTFTSS